MFRFKARLQHILNPLHVYCRLAPILGKRKAMALAHLYEDLSKKIVQQGIRPSPLSGDG